jgi:ABC-type multidrug transport system fused ATPase/permease subunit
MQPLNSSNETPFGQIISRVSRDLQTVDQELAILAVASAHFLVALVGIVILVGIITPAFLIPGAFISAAYYLIGAIYMSASRNLKVIESSQHSSLFQYLGGTLSGIITIRAYGAVSQSSSENFVRIDKANRPSFFLAAAERWLVLRLGLMGAFVSLSAGGFAVSNVGKLSAGAIGLSMSYAIVFSEHVLWLVRYQTANL